MSDQACIQITISIVLIFMSQNLVWGQAVDAPGLDDGSREVYQSIIDIQQQLLRQGGINDLLSTRLDALECENEALNQQINALEDIVMGQYEIAAEGAAAVLGGGDSDVDGGQAVVVARYHCADRCTQHQDCYAFMFDTANNQCRLKIYGTDLNVNESPSSTQIRYKKHITTCRDHLQTTQDRSKFVYVELEGGQLVKTLCTDSLDGAIWAFPHPQAAKYMPSLETDAVMLVYQSRSEGSGSHPPQYYAKFRQLPRYRGTPLQLTGNPSRRRIQFVRSVRRGTLNGFTVNNHDESFSNCDPNPNSRIELVTQSYICTSYPFTQSFYGLCQRLVSKSYFSKMSEGSELPYEVFMGLNAYFGGCGGACGTNRAETEVDGVALGIQI